MWKSLEHCAFLWLFCILSQMAFRRLSLAASITSSFVVNTILEAYNEIFWKFIISKCFWSNLHAFHVLFGILSHTLLPCTVTPKLISYVCWLAVMFITIVKPRFWPPGKRAIAVTLRSEGNTFASIESYLWEGYSFSYTEVVSEVSRVSICCWQIEIREREKFNS